MQTSPSTTNYKVIVCAAILNHEKKILLTRRKSEKILGGFWEFPGGKLEHGEGLEEALQREILEELDVTISVDQLLHITPHVYDHGAVLALFYLCHLKSGDVKLKDHDAKEWVSAAELSTFKLLPANQKVIEILLGLGL